MARLEQAGLRASREADKATLLRRVTYDLIGLPPTNAERHAFLADDSDQAYERVVDRLLASPRFGERWAQHWLDLVRYAETLALLLARDNLVLNVIMLVFPLDAIKQWQMPG